MTSFAIHPEMPSVMYVGGGRGTVMWSNDSGASWTESSLVTADGDGSYARQILPDPLDSSVAWAQDGSTLFKTEDGGVSWSLVYGFGLWAVGTKAPILRLEDGSLVLTDQANGLFQSFDEGETWTSISVAGGGTDLAVTSDGLLLSTSEAGVWRIHW
jgi:photosystem II stability/assembly factor-like uncharacterized protein